jgi:hypothetical protein
VPWPFGRDRRLKSPFAQHLLASRSDWEDRVAQYSDIEEPNRVVILSASAGATVAFGGLGSHWIEQFRDADVMLPKPDGTEVADHVVQFAHALAEPSAIEAAYRVATWGLISELGAFFWRPNYELEMHECAKAFEFRNDYEGQVPALGEPVPKDASIEERAHRRHSLNKGTLLCMIGAAIGEPLDWDDMFVGVHVPIWLDQFSEGLDVADERLKQLSPQGLPIWEE